MYIGLTATFKFTVSCVVDFLRTNLFCQFLSKTCLEVRYQTACFPTRYTCIDFKCGTPHTEVVYAHQASIFRAPETRGNVSSHSSTKIGNVKNDLLNIFVMYALGSVHEKFDQWGPRMDSLQSRTDRLLILGSTQITSVVLKNMMYC